jgi:hypothetical protein
MAQRIKKASIFGRVGTAIGKGLAEQVPKEAENYRLRTGLKSLADQADKGNLSPAQFLAQAAGTYGATPQMIQSFGDLARQQNYLKSVDNQYQGNQDKSGNQNGNKGYVPSAEEFNAPKEEKEKTPTYADAESTEQSYRNYIPPNKEQERQNAYERFNKNPERYGRNFDNAVAEEESNTQREMERQKAYQNQEKIALDKEKIVKDALTAESTKLGHANGTIPPLAYQKFEQKVLKSMLPKKEGGKGLTQQQAVNEVSQDLDDAYINYKNLSSLSPWSPRDFNSRLNAIQKDLSKRGEEKQLKQKLVSDYQVSPDYASHRAYPLDENAKKEFAKIGSKQGMALGSVSGIKIPPVNHEALKKAMGTTGSPLAFAYELDQKGRDSRAWLKYLDENRDDLQGWQSAELGENRNIINLNDIWLQGWE